MSDVSADLRIFPNKEMFSVDMAEVLDAAILKDGIIQGCSISITNGVLNITAGRIVISGRLGVITAGSIPIPTLSSQQTCSVVAVCDLRTSANPFYVAIVDTDGLQTLNSAKSSGDGFNVEGTLDYVVLGTVVVNPVTGLVSDWTPSADAATAHKGKKVYQEVLDKINALVADRAWSTVNADGFKGQTWATIPAGASEAFVEVYVAWDTQKKVSVDFYLPFNNWIYTTSSASRVHANHWGSSWDGVVALETRIVNGSYQVRLLHSYKGTNNEAASTSWRVFYR